MRWACATWTSDDDASPSIAGRLIQRAAGLAALLLFAAAPAALAQSPRAAETTDQVIVKFRDGSAEARMAPRDRAARIAAHAGVRLQHRRNMAMGADVVQLPQALLLGDAAALARRIAMHPAVEYAEPDRKRRAVRAAPNDQYANLLTYLSTSATGIGAYSTGGGPSAWDVTTGSPAVVVAIVDSGIVRHADLNGRILAGYDFISDVNRSNDGDGRDADPTDPGDWVSAEDKTLPWYSDCDVKDSAWHGTAVAGIIAANANNGVWGAGIDWNARIVPVRVLGKCTGLDSDIIDGIAWAAGLAVPGVPSNPNPAQVINLSLSGSGPCAPPYRNLFAAAIAHGVTRAIVAAAGNDSDDVANRSPASCPQVIAVAATSPAGNLADYSNYGAGIALSAPGGESHRSDGSGDILLLSNTGTRGPALDTMRNGQGTSFATAMVSGTAALMLGLAPTLSAAQLQAMLVGAVKPFPAGSDCASGLCGAGIVDANAAVRAASAAAPKNYEGLWWRAPAGSESGWGLNIAHQGDVLFLTWFTYDATGRAWWLTSSAERTSGEVFAGALVATRGPPFGATPFSPLAVSRSNVGTVTLAFGDANNATFSYTVNGFAQSKPITRQVFGPLPTCAWGGQGDLALATNYQDLWYAAPADSESGWGVNFTHQGDIIFAAWFTYDTDGAPLWLSATALKTAPGVYAGALMRTTGPPFNAAPFEPAAVARAAVGELTISFADGNHASFAYTVALAGPGSAIAQTKQITRQIFRAPGTLCR